MNITIKDILGIAEFVTLACGFGFCFGIIAVCVLKAFGVWQTLIDVSLAYL